MNTIVERFDKASNQDADVVLSLAVEMDIEVLLGVLDKMISLCKGDDVIEQIYSYLDYR